MSFPIIPIPGPSQYTSTPFLWLCSAGKAQCPLLSCLLNPYRLLSSASQVWLCSGGGGAGREDCSLVGSIPAVAQRSTLSTQLTPQLQGKWAGGHKKSKWGTSPTPSDPSSWRTQRTSSRLSSTAVLAGREQLKTKIIQKNFQGSRSRQLVRLGKRNLIYPSLSPIR